MIKAEPKKSFEIMGADVKQSGEAFEKSARPTCAGRTARRTRSSSPASTPPSRKEAADLLLEIGIIKQIPDLSELADTRFIK